METTRTYKAIITGMVVLFAGALVWLMISREAIQMKDRDMDQLKLKYEAILSEKLQVEKSLEKEELRSESLETLNRSLSDSIKMNRHALLARDQTNRSLKRSLRRARKIEHDQNNTRMVLQRSLDDAQQRYRLIQLVYNAKADSIKLLIDNLSLMRHERDLAAMRAIDRTLLVAERRNGKLTSKARRAKKLVARVDVPSHLQNLSFVLTGPDDQVLNYENNFLAREIIDGSSLSASIQGTALQDGKSKTMELICEPGRRLQPGSYVLKIYSGDVYVGSVTTMLAPRPE